MKLCHFVGNDLWMCACLKVCGKRWFIMQILCWILLLMWSIFDIHNISKLDQFLSLYKGRRDPTLLGPLEINSFHHQTVIQWWFSPLHIMTTEPVSEILCLLHIPHIWTVFNIIFVYEFVFYVLLRSLPLIFSMIAFPCQH
jgi:hypothetical protein